MKQFRRVILFSISSMLVFFATGCRNVGPVTKYGVEYQTRYGVPATYMLKKNKINKDHIQVKNIVQPYKENNA